MSTVLQNSKLSDSKPESAVKPKLRWLREPLLHFLLLGGLLFAIDYLHSDDKQNPNTIIVSADFDDEADKFFKSERGREPSLEEMSAMQKVWLENELLYREGIALQLDKGDETIRDRIIFKALNIIEANLKLPAYDDNLLKDWFEKHHAKYDEPVRFNFEEAVLAGENNEQAVREFVKELNKGASGDSQAGLRVFKNRPYSNVEQSYGAGFVKELQTMHSGEWRALKTENEWRAIRVDELTEAKPASYENLRSVVLQDWTDAKMAELRSAAIQNLAKKYKIVVEEAPES